MPLFQFWYFTYGTKDVLERECKHLHRKLRVELDGKEIKLPPIEGIVVLNIASWGGGCRPWQIGSGAKEVPEARWGCVRGDRRLGIEVIDSWEMRQ